jgi:hypothetical protein
VNAGAVARLGQEDEPAAFGAAEALRVRHRGRRRKAAAMSDATRASVPESTRPWQRSVRPLRSPS